MSEDLTLSEIEARYPLEWVLIDDVQISPTMELQGGKVLWHSKDRDQVDQKAMELRPKHFAVRHTGPGPEIIVTRLLVGFFEPIRE